MLNDVERLAAKCESCQTWSWKWSFIGAHRICTRCHGSGQALAARERSAAQRLALLAAATGRIGGLLADHPLVMAAFKAHGLELPATTTARECRGPARSLLARSA